MRNNEEKEKDFFRLGDLLVSLIIPLLNAICRGILKLSMIYLEGLTGAGLHMYWSPTEI